MNKNVGIQYARNIKYRLFEVRFLDLPMTRIVRSMSKNIGKCDFQTDEEICVF